MKIFTFVNNPEIINIRPSISWWITSLDIISYQEWKYPRFVLFGDIDANKITYWFKYGKYFDNKYRRESIIPTTGFNGKTLSITRKDSMDYVHYDELVEIDSYESLVRECIQRDIPVSNFNYVSDDMTGWSK